MSLGPNVDLETLAAGASFYGPSYWWWRASRVEGSAG
jgi:hypothetical protein